MSDETKLSRREFLKDAAVAGAAAAAASTVGPLAVTPAAAQGPTKYAWETPPAPISASQIKETVTADVVVVGAGTTGMAAALAAGQAGAKTILIEKGETFMAHGGHNGSTGSRLQKELGIQIDKDQVFQELVRWYGNKADAKLIGLWLDKNGETMDWLLDMAKAAGITVSLYQFPRPMTIKDEYYKEWPTAHMFGGMSQANVLKLLETNAKAKGVEVRYKTPAVQLIREGKGRVTGVVAKNDKGDYVQFNAKNAVILATGDYGHDPEMMQKYCAWAVGVPNIYMPAINTGDGHKMGLWVGAAMEEAPHAPMIHILSGTFTAEPFLHVNILGERYENEDVPNQYLANGLVRQPGMAYWTVYDANWPDQVWKLGAGLGKIVEVTDATRKSFADAVANGTVQQADTIEALAEKIKVPVETFKATVARYNELAKQGKDPDFGKRPDRLTPIAKAPFYASKGTPSLLVVVGGLKINAQGQVLDADRKVIPGLYAAGNVSGGFFATDYPVMIPGLSHGRALTFGRLAGMAAAKDKPQA